MSRLRLGALAVLLVFTLHCSDDESGGSSGTGGGPAGAGGSGGSPGGTGGTGGTVTGGAGGSSATGGSGATGGALPVVPCNGQQCPDGFWCASETSKCIPWGWGCSLWEYGDATCSCGCGAPDPACADSAAKITGCAPGRKCSSTGKCEGVPGSWTCDAKLYAAKDGCDCKCGVVDADCVPGGAAKGCTAGEACSDAGSCVKPTAAAPVVTLDTYPKVDGATATHPLAMVIACELFGMPWRWGYGWGPDGRTIQPDPNTVAEQDLASKIAAKVVHTKTHQSYLNLIDGAADLILVASKPSTSELAYAATKGVTLDVKLVARDALVFLVNNTNPVMSLSPAQLKGIYTKAIGNWSEVGGAVKPINPYIRQTESGSQQLMDELVMKGTPMGTFPDWLLASYMGGLVDQIRIDPLAIGYSVYYFVTYQYTGQGARLLKIDGVWPTYDTLQKQTYPLTSETLVVTRTNLGPTSTAAQMKNWLLAPEGQTMVKKSGYVPVYL